MTSVSKWLSRLLVVATLVTSGLVAVAGSAGAANSTASSVWPLLVAPAQRQGLFYLLTSQPCGKERCLRLYRTRDDVDRTWDSALRLAQVKMPPYGRLARTPQGTVMAMVFTTPKIGYILEGNSEAQQLYVTRNGAHSWEKSPIPRDDTIWGLTATSTHLYALFLHRSFAAHGCSYIELVHAPLRATYWRGVKIPFGQFYDEPLGEVTGHGEMMMFAESTKNGEKIYVSHNGGRSFTSSTHPNLRSSVVGCSLAAEKVQTVWAICTTKARVTLHVTEDSGSSWSVFVRQPHNINAGGIFAMTNTDDFSYVYTGTATRNIVRLNFDANREHIVGTLQCHSVASMIFVGVGHGYAVCNLVNGATALDRTTNGGASWRSVSVSPPSN
ncbi:MAG: hypothetical protein WA359_05655 [Acidimicrobiales bacterium]